MNDRRLTLTIYGLAHGGGGSLIVERALVRLPGVLRVSVNPMTEMAYVEYDAAVTNAARLVAVVEEAGFEVSVHAAR